MWVNELWSLLDRDAANKKLVANENKDTIARRLVVPCQSPLSNPFLLVKTSELFFK